MNAIPFEIYRDEYRIYHAKNDDLGIHVISETISATETEIQEEFEILICEYVLTDEKLSPAALRLRNRILDYIRY